MIVHRIFAEYGQFFDFLQILLILKRSNGIFDRFLFFFLSLNTIVSLDLFDYFKFLSGSDGSNEISHIVGFKEGLEGNMKITLLFIVENEKNQ